jgi:hypothetical protein
MVAVVITVDVGDFQVRLEDGRVLRHGVGRILRRSPRGVKERGGGVSGETPANDTALTSAAPAGGKRGSGAA